MTDTPAKPAAPALLPINLLLQHSSGKSFERNFLRDPGAMNLPASTIIKRASILNDRLSELKIPHLPIQVRDKNNVLQTVGYEAILWEHGKTLHEAGFGLYGHDKKRLTSEQLKRSPSASAEYRAKEQERTAAEKRTPAHKKPDRKPARRDFRDWASNADIFIKIIAKCRSYLPDNFDSLSEEQKRTAILDAFRKPEIGRELSQGRVLHRMLMLGTNAQISDVAELFSSFQSAQENFTPRQTSSYFCGSTHIPALIQHAVHDQLEKVLPPREQRAFQQTWAFYALLPDKNRARDLPLNISVRGLLHRHNISTSELIDALPHGFSAKQRKAKFDSLNLFLKGKDTTTPDSLDFIVSRLHKIALNREDAALLSEIGEFCETHEIPYIEEKGYCIRRFEDLMEAYQDERPPLSIMLRDLRSLAELRMSTNQKELQECLSQIKGSQSYESPQSYKHKPTANQLEALTTLFISELTEKKVMTDEYELQLRSWLIEAGKGEYPRHGPIGNIPLEKYNAASPENDRWAKFYARAHDYTHR